MKTKVFTFILLITISLSNLIAASVYDEINQIKREGSEYDASLNSSVPTLSPEAQSALFPALVHGQKGINKFESGHIGDRIDPDFGNSKYDKGLTADDLLYSDRTLEGIRNERRNEEMKKISINILIGITIIGFIVFLVRRSNNLKSKSDEINK